MKFIASLGITWMLINIVLTLASVFCWGTGVLYGFHHSLILGIVSLIPPVGFIEGILHLLNVLI